MTIIILIIIIIIMITSHCHTSHMLGYREHMH